MNRLSALDASFIYGETPETPMNVGSLAIFAPPANPDDVFAHFRDHNAARLDSLPLYRRRLEMTPFGPRSALLCATLHRQLRRRRISSS